MNQFYSKKLIAKYLLWIILALVAMKFTAGIAFAAIIPFAVFAMVNRNPQNLFFVLLLSIASIVTNSFFAPKTLAYFICQRGVMVAVGCITAIQVFGQRHSPVVKVALAIFVYIVYMFFVSQGGYAPVISNLKLGLFMVSYLAIYAVSLRMVEHRSNLRQLRSMLLALAIVFLFGSVLLIPFTGVAYMGLEELQENPDVVSLFKGMTCHSQELGPVATLWGLFLAADLLFSVQRADKLYIALLLTVPFLIYKTSSRTAMGTFVACLVFLGYCVMLTRGMRIRWRRKVFSFFSVSMVVVAVSVFAIPSMRDHVVKFVAKRGGDSSQIVLDKENLFSTRQARWNMALDGWRKSPYLGNGFQVSEEMKYKRVSSLKDMLSAPIEKCSWIYANLEEGGIFGQTIFVCVILFMFFSFMRYRAYTGATMFMATLILNMGEYQIFSMSSTGGFEWMLIFTGLVCDVQRHKEKIWQGRERALQMQQFSR